MTAGNSNGKLGLADDQHHQQPRQIYLSKPGGQREGPFTVAQINQDLAAKRYRDTDYWAWYDGLAEWVPLHAVPGVYGPGRPAPLRPPEAKKTAPAPAQPAAPSVSRSEPEEVEQLFTRATNNKPTASRSSNPAPVAPKEVQFSKAATTNNSHPTPQAQQPAPTPSKAEVHSGLPFAALEQIFIFTTGDGRGLLQSPAVAGMLKDVVGEEISAIRGHAARDIIGHCDFGERLRRDGAIPDAAWRAMGTLKPEVVQKAREGTYSACIRTFTTGAKEVVALFLFYNKSKM